VPAAAKAREQAGVPAAVEAKVAEETAAGDTNKSNN
jgi:hypothetical protein